MEQDDSELPSIDLLKKAVEVQAVDKHPKLLRTRALMAEAVDQSLQYNLERIDALIQKLNSLKLKLMQGSTLVKNEINGHYEFASEALGFADKIEQRFFELEKNGHEARQTQEATPAPTDPGGDDVLAGARAPDALPF